MKASAINRIGDGFGVTAVATGAAGAAEIYPLISMVISGLTFGVFFVFRVLHYRLAKKNHDKNLED